MMKRSTKNVRRFSPPISEALGESYELQVTSAEVNQQGNVTATLQLWNGDVRHADDVALAKHAARKGFARVAARLAPDLSPADVEATLLRLSVSLPPLFSSEPPVGAGVPPVPASRRGAYPLEEPAEPGSAVLDAVQAFLARFVIYPSPHALTAHVLWIGHTHLMDAWECTPRLAFLSPESASGKTRALEVTELMVPRPVEAVNVSPAYLFRKVGGSQGRPTILYDEIDTVFGPKAKENEEIRGLLNAGYRVGAVAGRCVVTDSGVETEEFPAYCAVALAGLGTLPDTILTRSVIVRMRRRLPGERAEAYRRRVHAPEGYLIRDRLAAWATTVTERASTEWPELPDGVEDRNADIWEPLLAVADLAGGDWAERARRAAVTLVAEARSGTPSLNVRLLSDLREIFGDQPQMATQEIIDALLKLEESPWGELNRGRPITPSWLAECLKQFEARPQSIRLKSGGTAKGYKREHLIDAWTRYLSPTQSIDPRAPVLGDSSPPNSGTAPADVAHRHTSLREAGTGGTPAPTGGLDPHGDESYEDWLAASSDERPEVIMTARGLAF